MTAALGPEVQSAAKAIGLLSAHGSLNADWFADPSAKLKTILSSAGQRAALLDLLGQLLPPAPAAGAPAGETWFPLLGEQPRGNLYLTAKNGAAPHVTIGCAAVIEASPGAETPSAALSVRLPLARFSASAASSVAGTPDGPLEVSLRVRLDLAPPADAITLRAARILVKLISSPSPSASVAIVLEGLDIDGTGARDMPLDPGQLGPPAVHVLVGLIGQKLGTLAGAGPEAAAVAAHLMSLLGLGEGLPPLPLAELTKGPAAFQAWLNALVAEPARMKAWLQHLAGLFGAGAVTASGSGTMADPWRVPLVPLGQGALNATAFLSGGRLHLGVEVALRPTGLNPAARVEAQASIIAIPLSGIGDAQVLPRAIAILRAPGGGGALATTGQMAVSALRAGLAWDGTALAPLLELVDVDLGGSQHDRIDLANADSVVAAASGAVKMAVEAALGTAGPGRQLAALAGLVAPASDPAWPFSVDSVQLVSHPTRAIAAVHRAALLSGGHPWVHLFSELAALLGLGGGVTGAGTRANPWRVPLAPAVGLRLDLAAWNEETSGSAADPQRLRLGLRAGASKSGWDVWWLAELLAADLPADGEGDLGLMAGHHVSFQLQPVPSIAASGGVSVSAASFGVTADWSAGASMRMRAAVTGLSVAAGGATVNVPLLEFPTGGPVDVTNPAATYGIAVGEFEALVRILLGRAALSWGGVPAFTAAALAGLHDNLPGLPPDWPLLRDPGAPGSMFANPLAALRDWLGRVATTAAADGTSFPEIGLRWLKALLMDQLPGKAWPAGFSPPPVDGSGTHDDPWAFSVTSGGARPIEVLTWLEPAGPPPSWAAPLAGQLAAPGSFPHLLETARTLGAFAPQIGAALRAVDVERISAHLFYLSRYLMTSDGVVPVGSQRPTGGAWTAGSLFECAHDRQPAHASAIAQILGQLAAWAPLPASRAVLLLGPAFNDHTQWSALLAAAPGIKSPAAHFGLRQPGVDPASIDLAGVTAVADYYTADLADGGTGDLPSLTMQIGRVVDRIRAIRPGLKVTLVAHSTAGTAARAYAAANAAKVAGLITLGTSHAGTPLSPLLDEPMANAVRLIRSTGVALPAGSIRDAIDHLARGLDGYLAPAGPDGLPVTWPYPVGSFAGTDTTATGGVPALALASQVSPDLLQQLGQAFAAMATAIAASVQPAPTHLAFGLRAQLAIPEATLDEPGVDARVRADAFRVALSPGAPPPSRPERSLAVSIAIERPNGWVLGSPLSYQENGILIDARIRRAELGVTIVPAGSGGVSVAPAVRLHDAGWHGPTDPRIELGDPRVGPLLGALFRAISPPDLGASTGVAVLLDALEALGLVVPAVAGGLALSAEAFTALQVDAAGFLLPRFGAALDLPDGLGGLKGPFGGPYALPASIGPFELYLARTPSWRIGLRTTGEGFAFAGFGAIALDLTAAAPALSGAAQLALRLGALNLDVSAATGQCTLSAPPWIPALALRPLPSPAVVTAVLGDVLPRLLLSAGASAILEAAVGNLVPVGPIDALLASPGGSMQKSGALGDGTVFDGAKISLLLEAVAKFAGLPGGPGLNLPGGVRVTASGAGTVTFAIETTAAIGGVLNLALTAAVDPLRHVTPGGTASISIAAAPGQPQVEVTFGVSAAGVSLTVSPEGIGPIQLLPSFSGLGALAGGAASLLTQALDALDAALAGAGWYQRLRDIAIALDLHAGGAYGNRQAQWKALLQPGWLGSLDVARQTQGAAALVQLFASPDLPGLPGTFSASERGLAWTFTPAGAVGSLGVKVGWTNSGAPILQLLANGLKLGAGAATLDASAGYVPGPDPVGCSAALRFSLASSLGVPADPVLSFARAGASYELKFLPLGAGTDSAMKLRLAPSPQLTVGPMAPADLTTHWILPLVGAVLVDAARPTFSTPVWPGGKTVRQLLEAAGLLGAGDVFALPSAPVAGAPLSSAVVGLLSSLAAGAGLGVDVTDTLQLRLVSQANRVGVRLKGRVDLPAGNLKVGVLFGEPASLAEESTAGVALMLFSGASLAPRLDVIGLGVSLAVEGGAALVNLPVLRLARAAGALFFSLDLQNFPSDLALGAGVELGQVSIPLGQAVSSNLGGNNPVAASLLQSDGTAGPPTAPAPAVDVVAKYKSGTFSISFQGQSGALWIPVQRAFGPIYIDQIGLEIIDVAPRDKRMALVVDGKVTVSGLTVQADDLSVEIPFRSLASPGSWTLDLRGMAVAYSGPGIAIGGGLVKNPGPPVQYDGILTVDVAGQGFTAVGSYARPTDAQGAYTSLFIFASLPIPLGGPPCFFVTGLGGGAGLNRQLIPPENVEDVPGFFLVQAIDDPTFGNNPMDALLEMGERVPAKRGAFWLAAGVRFDSFVIVHSVAVIYVALDRGFEVGVLGVSRMALPTEELALAKVELALKARFSTAEGVLSIQAQLTENSYILSPDCRLTGGFAFFIWFPKGQFVLTLGGYHPGFQAPKEFPVVPRLGFRWRNGPVVTKGEAYFALTNSCVMAGGRLEVAYDLDWVRAWFAAWADFLISWDPFHYDIRIGVEVGVSARIEICVVVCGTLSIDLSIGADVHIFGPPLHADVTVDLEVVSFTISFGADPRPEPNYIESWSTFRDKYLTAGDQDKKAVAARVVQGLLPPVPPGAEPAPGTKDQPWRVGAEFAFLTETRMPASSWSTFAHAPDEGKAGGAASLHIAPMHKLSVESSHEVELFVGTTDDAPDYPVEPDDGFRVKALIGLFPEATWRHSERQKAAANTIPAVSGLSIAGAAVLHGQSDLIPISEMVDDLPALSLPLPFATNNASRLAVLNAWGLAGQDLWVQIAPAASTRMLSAARQVLSGSGPFAAVRRAAGVREQGLSPLALHTLGTRRSAPPLVAPLTAGLTMAPVGLPLPPAILQLPERPPVPVRQHRLLAVLQGRVAAAFDAPPALHTSVETLVAARNVPRMAAPRAKSRPGAMLKRIPAAKSVRPTRAAAPFRVVTSTATGTLSGRVHAKNFASLAARVAQDGVVIPAGSTQVWEVAPGETSLRLSGPGAARVVCLDAGGGVLSDIELVPETETLAMPQGTAMVAVQCLGQFPRTLKAPPPGFGAVTLAAAPARGAAGVGWEMEDVREQIATSLVLGRGASLRFARPHLTRHRGQKTPWSMARIGDIASAQHGMQTRLPTRVSVVMVILDARDPCAVEEGDFAIAVDGAILKTPPVPVGGGRRRALLYDVAEPTRSRDFFTVSLASKEGWRVAGVIGLAGRAIEWANRWHGNVPEDMAPVGPLTPHGSVRIQLVRSKGPSARRIRSTRARTRRGAAARRRGAL